MSHPIPLLGLSLLLILSAPFSAFAQPFPQQRKERKIYLTGQKNNLRTYQKPGLPKEPFMFREKEGDEKTYGVWFHGDIVGLSHCKDRTMATFKALCRNYEKTKNPYFKVKS